MDSRMADGTRGLFLEIEQVERYAGSIIVAARDNTHGVPAVEVARVLSPAMRFPRIPHQERLRRDQELPMLECVIELLLEHGLCLNHEGRLIFPSLFQVTQPEAGTDFSHAISLHYDFSGPIDNIYASLITSLTISRHFGPVRPPGAQRELFINFIEAHLREQGVELLERLSITCRCGRVYPEEVVRERLQEGHGDIGCSRCDFRTPLTLGAQQARGRNPELMPQLRALRTNLHVGAGDDPLRGC